MDISDKEKEQFCKKFSDPVRQAGAIVYRKDDSGGIQLLLVRSRKNPVHLLFPKGHIEEGESETETARRELLEEAGVEGELAGFTGVREFRLDDRAYRVTYFVFKFEKIISDGEPGRMPSWYSIGDAVEKVSFSDLRDLIKQSIPVIENREKK
ncbi:NUDIX domain protein [Chitinispirillum alkaliphilum]|nr:NUDIX domain protein [Chitinispirillum alkaliphilum]